MKTIKKLEAEPNYKGTLTTARDGAIYALKDVLGLIVLRIKALKAKQKEVSFASELYGLECMIAELEELKKRING